MSGDDIIELARKAGVRDDGHEFRFSEFRYLENFVRLIRQQYRSEIVESLQEQARIAADKYDSAWAMQMADAVRARR
jgi:hypothetical protein